MHHSTKSWYLIVEPKYRIPHVFNLNKNCRFKGLPSITRRVGARIIANKELEVSIEYRYLVDTPTVHEGQHYTHMTQQGLIALSSEYSLDMSTIDREVKDSETRQEIISMHKKWTEEWLPVKTDGGIDLEAIQEKVAGAIHEAKKKLWREIKKRNEQWVNARLPLIRLGIAGWPESELISEDLYETYERLGGKDDKAGLMKKVAQFYTISFTTEPDGLQRLDGNTWQDEDEIWDCWLGFMGDESEAGMVFEAMMQVFKPQQSALSG